METEHRLTLTGEEYNTLNWVANRFCAAEVLRDCGDWTCVERDTWVATFSPGAMWGYIAALHALEDFDFPPPAYSPCIGGALADKLTALVESFPTDMEFRGIER